MISSPSRALHVRNGGSRELRASKVATDLATDSSARRCADSALDAYKRRATVIPTRNETYHTGKTTTALRQVRSTDQSRPLGKDQHDDGHEQRTPKRRKRLSLHRFPR